MRALVVAALLVMVAALSLAEEVPHAEPMRPGVAAGMGVDYISPMDIVDMINGNYRPTSKVDDFHAGVDFFVAGFIPLSREWMLKIEYAFLLNTYNITGMFGPGEFTMKAHMPTLVLHYMLVDGGLYNLSAGLGGGFHMGKLATEYGTLVDSYSSNGFGGVAEVQGNTAISEHLFVHLGGSIRWERIGELRNDAGTSPGINANGKPVRMSWFSAGARIGVSCYF
jgi:hypothetical protein